MHIGDIVKTPYGDIVVETLAVKGREVIVNDGCIVIIPKTIPENANVIETVDEKISRLQIDASNANKKLEQALEKLNKLLKV